MGQRTWILESLAGPMHQCGHVRPTGKGVTRKYWTLAQVRYKIYLHFLLFFVFNISSKSSPFSGPTSLGYIS